MDLCKADDSEINLSEMFHQNDVTKIKRGRISKKMEYIFLKLKFGASGN